MPTVKKTAPKKKVVSTKKTTKPVTKPTAKVAPTPAPTKAAAPVATAKPAVKASATRTRKSKPLFREVTVKKLTELYGEDGIVLCSANAVEARQLEILKDKAQLELAL